MTPREKAQVCQVMRLSWLQARCPCGEQDWPCGCRVWGCRFFNGESEGVIAEPVYFDGPGFGEFRDVLHKRS